MNEFIMRPFLHRDTVDVGTLLEFYGVKVSRLDGCKAYVACFLEHPVGVIYTKKLGNYLHIKQLLVHQDFTRMGAGRGLINYVADKAKDIKQIHLLVPLDTQHLSVLEFFKKDFKVLGSRNDFSLGECVAFYRDLSEVREKV